MKTIQRNKTAFQIYLVWIKYLFFFGAMPTKEIKPYIFISPVAAERKALKQAAARFELIKRGVTTI